MASRSISCVCRREEKGSDISIANKFQIRTTIIASGTSQTNPIAVFEPIQHLLQQLLFCPFWVLNCKLTAVYSRQRQQRRLLFVGETWSIFTPHLPLYFRI